MSEHPARESIFVVKSRKGYEAREAIMAAAIDLASDGGIAALNVQRVAKRAGVSRPSFYNYFNSIDTLISELIDRLRIDIEEALVKIHRQHDRGAERFAACLSELLALLAADAKLARFADHVMTAHESARTRFQDAIRPEIDAAVAAGDFQLTDTEIGTYLDLVTATVFAIVHGGRGVDDGVVTTLLLRAAGAEGEA